MYQYTIIQILILVSFDSMILMSIYNNIINNMTA